MTDQEDFPPPPLSLDVRRSGSQVTASVVGRWELPFAAEFTLNISNGSNSTTHRSVVNLVCAREEIFSKVQMEVHRQGDFNAHLEVVPAKGDVYNLYGSS